MEKFLARLIDVAVAMTKSRHPELDDLRIQGKTAAYLFQTAYVLLGRSGATHEQIAEEMTKAMEVVKS